MYVNIKTVRDDNLRSFLNLLKRFKLKDVFVVGGAVRDMIFSQPCNDIDVAIRIKQKSPQTLKNYYKNNYVFHPAIRKQLKPLAKALKCDVETFYRPINYEEISIDILGLYIVEDNSQTCYPDIFVDSDDKIFGAQPELTVNRIAIDIDGRIWPDSHINDCRLRMARFTNAPLPPSLRQIVRAFYVANKFNLKFSNCSLLVLKDYFQNHTSESLLAEELKEENTLNLIKSLQRLLNSRNYDSELEKFYDSFQKITGKFF
jgi:hypothetical protein